MARKNPALEKSPGIAAPLRETAADPPREAHAGRPLGAKTLARELVTSLPPACTHCGSTRREPYKDGVVQEERYEGQIHGRRYNRIVWRRTRCVDCGQSLTVREYRYEPPGTPHTPCAVAAKGEETHHGGTEDTE